MMALQARETCVPHTRRNQVFRAYASNSPRAKARLLVLAMLADGRLADAELESLARHGTFAQLGIAREDFLEVLWDFCADAENLPDAGGSYLLSPAVLQQLFAEVSSPAEQQRLLRLIFDMIRSDGHLAGSEADLFCHAADTWTWGDGATPSALGGKPGAPGQAAA